MKKAIGFAFLVSSCLVIDPSMAEPRHLAPSAEKDEPNTDQMKSTRWHDEDIRIDHESSSSVEVEPQHVSEDWSILRDLRAWRVFTSSDGGTSTNNHEKATSDQGAGREKESPSSRMLSTSRGWNVYKSGSSGNMSTGRATPSTGVSSSSNMNGIKTTGTSFRKKKNISVFNRGYNTYDSSNYGTKQYIKGRSKKQSGKGKRQSKKQSGKGNGGG